MEEIIKTEMLTKIYNPLSQNPKLALDQISLRRIYYDYGKEWFRKNYIVEYFIDN
mgnify:CR=1 FL=1